MQFDFWRRQEPGKPLFPDTLWNKPEQRSHAGKLAIVGGNKLGFVSVGEAYNVAASTGVGQIRAIVPDALKGTIPSNITDVFFLPSNLSGGFSREAWPEFRAACDWADALLLIGDTGRNSETAGLFEQLLTDCHVPIILTRDAFDLLKPAVTTLVARENTTVVLSFAQLQKLFQGVFYPKILSFSMQLAQLVDALHKFTITYPLTVVTYHSGQLIVAHNGDVITTKLDDPMMIWRGLTATKAASWLIWSPQQPLEAIATSYVE